MDKLSFLGQTSINNGRDFVPLYSKASNRRVKMFFTKEDRKLTMLTRMMKLFGLWFYYDVSPRTKLSQRFRVYGFQFLNCIAQLAAFNVGFKKLYLESSGGNNLMGIMYVHLQLIVFFKNLKYLHQFVFGMKKILEKRVSRWEMEIFDEFSSKAWAFIKFEFYNLELFWAIILCTSAYDLALVIFTDSSEPFLQLNLFKGYLPSKNERSLILYVTLFCSYYQVFVGGLYIVCMLSMLPASVAYMCAQLRVVGRKLEMWSEDTRNPHRHLVLKEIIEEHNDILALIQIIRKYFGELYVFQNIIITLAITLSLFSVTKALNTGNMDLVFEIIYTLLGWIFLVFISCYFSQELCDESIRLSEVFYTITWYQETPKVRKDLLMMMMATKKLVIIDYKGIMPMNLYRFREVINASYSCFMLLQSVNV